MRYKPGKSQNHMRGKGGKRPGAGRKTDKYKAALEVAEGIVRQILATDAHKAATAYVKASLPHKAKILDHRKRLVTVDREPDVGLLKDYVGKFVSSKQTLDMNVAGSVEVYTNVNPDMGPKTKGS